MSHPDPFVPPSGAHRPGAGATPPEPPQPANGAYAPAPPAGVVPQYGAGGPWSWTPAPAVPSGLAGWTIGLAVAWTAVQVLYFVMSFEAAEIFARVIDAGGSQADVLTAYDSLGMLYAPIQVATFVVACLWLYRSRVLATMFSPRLRHTRRPVWVWLGWIVPVVALWFPFQVVRDVRSGTSGVRWTSGLRLWWVSWLVMIWTTSQAGMISAGFRSLDPAAIPYLEGVAAVAAVVGGTLWIRIVREITAAQRARLEAPSAV